MELSRRSLMASMLAAIIGGTTMSIDNAALADPVLGRYAMTIKLQEKLYATNRMFKEAKLAYSGVRWKNQYKSPKYDGPEHLKILFYRSNTEADELLAYMMKNFPPSNDVEAAYQVDDLMMKRISVDTMSIVELQKLMDATVPVAVAKNMISKENCVLDTMVMKQFDIFAYNYIHMLCGSRPLGQIREMYPEWYANRH